MRIHAIEIEGFRGIKSGKVRILMPNSKNPLERLSDYGGWLGQYGQFRAGDPPKAGRGGISLSEPMMKEHEFRAWLEQRGAQSRQARNTRAYAIRTIERKLEALGMKYRNLDQAWEDDRFETLQERLRKMREDARDGGQDYRILMPNSENPHKRLFAWGSYLGQYGQFRAGDPPKADRSQ